MLSTTLICNTHLSIEMENYYLSELYSHICIENKIKHKTKKNSLSNYWLRNVSDRSRKNTAVILRKYQRYAYFDEARSIL